jgi:hypothetical protein
LQFGLDQIITKQANRRNGGGCAMRLCPTCERPRIEGSQACSGCGRPYPAGLANLPDIVGFSRGRAAARKRPVLSPRPAAFVAIAIVLVVGGSGAAWLLGRHKPSSGTGAAQGFTSQATPPATPASSGPPSPPPSSSPANPSSANPGQATVTVTGAAAAGSVAVTAFLDKYFTAINSHHYNAYKAMYAAQLQQNMSRASFNSGYQGTIDSAIRLINITNAVDGDTQAVLKFTSHQIPTVADNEESCTKWSVSLFLVQDGGGGYLIDTPPPGYHAASAPCS